MSELQEYKKGLELNIQYATQANGTFPEEEKGLTDKQYIVPGAGGVGEILNNAFV